MIVSGQLMLLDQHGEKSDRVRLTPGYLRLDGTQIVEVVEGTLAEQPDWGGPQTLICPGFIDTHLHLPQFEMIGAHGMPLLQWLQQVTFPAERKWQNPLIAREMTQRAIDQCYAHGTTAICAFATIHGEAAEAALEVARQRRIRGVIGQVLMDRGAPDDLLRPIAAQIDETSRLLDRFPPGGRLAAAVSPRFAVSCSGELLHAAGELAARRDAVIQTHLAETQGECQLVSDLFAGASYVDVYRNAGLLTSRTLLGHGVHLDERDARAIAQSQAVIVHCPTANSFLRAGTMDRAGLRDQGVTLSLGSDVGAGYERSMVRVARAMIEAASSLGDDYPDVAEAWWQITYGNAKVLGWPDADRFVPGAPADVLVIQPDVAWLDADVDPLAMLMFAWDDRWLGQTIVAGELFKTPGNGSRRAT